VNDDPGPARDLTRERDVALMSAAKWGIALGTPFAMSAASYVSTSSDGNVLKVAWRGDDESLHEADALELWNGDGAVRLIRRDGPALLEERAIPGTDLSLRDDVEATNIAVELATRLWRPAVEPFRPVGPAVSRWLELALAKGNTLAPMARALFDEVGSGVDWVVHGDFHHHNILNSSRGFVAIDPKPYLADREYDVPAFLWNPMHNVMADRQRTEARIATFVAAGLDDYKIRACPIIRGSYLRASNDYVAPLRSLLSQRDRRWFDSAFSSSPSTSHK